MSERNYHAVLIDDHPLLGLSLKSALEPFDVVLELAEIGPPPAELAATIAQTSPACVVVDLGLPNPRGGVAYIEALVALDMTVGVLTGETDEASWAAAAEAGAAAVVGKGEPIEEIIHVVRRLCEGESVRPHQRAALLNSSRKARLELEEMLAPFATLTTREQEVLGELVAGKTQNEIAGEGQHSIHTVRTQVKSVLRKLGVRSQIEAVALANQVGWTKP